VSLSFISLADHRAISNAKIVTYILIFKGDISSLKWIPEKIGEYLEWREVLPWKNSFPSLVG
jgi:hypothetical protein